MSNIKLTDIDFKKIELEAEDIRRYRSTDYPMKDGAWVEMNNSTEYRVRESFEEVDRLVMEAKEKAIKK